MKQPTDTFFDTNSLLSLSRQLNDVVRRANMQLNHLTEGRIAALHTAKTAAPTQGLYAVGDFEPNADRGVIQGDPGSQYVLWGWVCTSTEPLEWAPLCIPTGT